VILLDTHAAIWFANDDDRLGKHSQAISDAALLEDGLAVSAVSFWEIALLASKHRLQLGDSPAALRDQLLDGGIVELPLTGDIALLSVDLPKLHADPADRFIAATAIVHGATLMTADEKLLRWRHELPRQNALR
jgi:PIN domain nuclease of toxin-antitoxin system